MGGAMSEAVYAEVEDAIRRRLVLGKSRSRSGLGPGYDAPRAIELGLIVVRDADCEPHYTERRITPEEWADRRERYGLWQWVGVWSFVPAGDEAADCIRYARRCPEAAGRELHALHKRVAELELDSAQDRG